MENPDILTKTYTTNLPITPPKEVVPVAKTSTTTLSNANVIDNKIPTLKNNLDVIKQKGATTLPDGSTRNADGSIIQPKAEQTADTGSHILGPKGEDYTVDASGQIVAGPTSGSYQVGSNIGVYDTTKKTVDQINAESELKINDMLDQMKASTDASTAAQIENIKSQFAIRKQQQADINLRQEKGVLTSLLMGGITGAGSSAQYAPISSEGTISAQETYGIQQLAQLDAEENNLIAQANAARDASNYKLLETKLSQVETKRKEKVDAATKLNESIAASNKAMQEQAYKASQDEIKNKLESDKFTWQQKKDMADIAIKQGQLTLDQVKAAQDKSVANLSSMPSPVITKADGTYDIVSQNEALAKLSPEDQAVVKAIGNYDMDIAKVTSLAGGKREALAAKVSMVYPGFDMTDYAAKAQYKKSLANTTISSAGGIINSANKMLNHLTEFVDYTSLLPNVYPIKTGNVALSNIGSFVSPTIRENLASAKTAAIGVKDELAKFFKGTGVADVQTMKDWEARINPAASEAELKGNAQAAIDLLQGQLLPMIDQYKATMKQDPPTDLFIKNNTLQNLSDLKNRGYRIDIPGVYYTNLDSYYKLGGGTPESLIKAKTDLKAIGAEESVQNALQWAQINNY